jgi:putative ABC transport system permease protein
MAIAGIGSLAASLADGLAQNGRIILGGDIAFTLAQREASAAERSFLAAQGRTSATATLRTIARTGDGRTALVELKSVDDAYPLYGKVTLDPPLSLAEALAPRTGAFGGLAENALLARLDLKPGDRITIGATNIEIRANLVSEPDKLAGGLGFGPRLIVSETALRTSSLLQPGSLVRWHYRVRLPENDASDAAVRRIIAEEERRLPEAGWDVRTRSNVSPSLEQNVERFTQYLTLVGLAALLVGGIGVANAVKSHLEQRRNVVAAMKALGATGGAVFVIYLIQTLAVAAIGALPGLALGAALPFAIKWIFGAAIPLPISPALHPQALALAFLFGMLTAAAFALWPLGRAHDVSVSALFRDQIAPEHRPPRLRYLLATGIVSAAAAALAIDLAYDRSIAAIFLAGAAGIFVVLRLVAALLMWICRSLPKSGLALLRLAVANVHRPGALTVSVVLSLGLGLALLVAVIEIEGNLRRQFVAALPDRAPSFFFLDIQSGDAQAFDNFIHARAPDAVHERVPMLRGRIVAMKGVPADEIMPPASAAWVLQSDRGITYSDEVPEGSRLVSGDWWKPDYRGPPLVSLEKKIADAFGLAIGDSLTVNVLGRNITAQVANLRTLDWQSLGINFVMVFAPSAFRGAPATHIATLTFPNGTTAQEEIALLKAVGDRFPSVTPVRVREAIEALVGVASNFVTAIRCASALTLGVALLVLGGAMAASHRNRLYDAVVLRMLGATRRQVLAAYCLEYLLIGSSTAVFGIAAGSAAAGLVVTQLMKVPFSWEAVSAATVAITAVAVMILMGLVGTFAVLSQKPAPVLRTL